MVKDKRHIVFLMVLCLATGIAGLAYAASEYWGNFQTAYVTSGRIPSTSPLMATTCLLCHTGYSQTKANASTVNSFGNDYANAGYDFTAIEGLDSDGDGYTNIAEILAGTYPGDANSKPAPPSPGDTTPPTVNGFTIPSSATTLTVSITSLTASDDSGTVAGYLLTESSTKPAASATGWVATPPTSYTFASAGAKTLYAWAKDAANNVSAGVSRNVTITLPDSTPPIVQSFTIPSSATTLTVSITSLTATDDSGTVTGYLVTESSTKPAASATGWTAAAPASYTFASAGTKTLYAWAKDAAGNVSDGVSKSVTITLPDSTPPIVQNFIIPSSATTLTVSITSFTASDDSGAVTGYLVTETSTKPAASATGWTAAGPTSYTFASAGTKTLYAWAKDAAGNVSDGVSGTIIINIPQPSSPSDISVSPQSLDFGDTYVGKPKKGMIEISNQSNRPVTLTEVKTDSAVFKVKLEKPVTIKAKRGYRLGVIFRPTDSGQATALLAVYVDHQNTGAATVSLKGTGIGIGMPQKKAGGRAAEAEDEMENETEEEPHES